MKKVLLILLIMLSITAVQANNIQVSNVTLTGQNVGSQFVLVQFDLSWENSWRISAGPSNWDAAWVFVKYRRNSGPWLHATINYVNGTPAGDGHTAPAGSTIKTSTDTRGCFVYRAADGSGDNTWNGVQLRWNYGVNGVQSSDVLDVQVYAIEMVYIPQGAYSLGATNFGGSEVDNFYYNTGSFGFQDYFSVTSENAITVSNAVGPTNLYYDVVSSENNGDQLGPIPALFPKGFNAFYMMKYEVSEEQWICFFNALTPAQQLNHDVTDATHKNSDAVVSRNTIAWTSGNATTAAPSRAINYTSWSDMSAYLDWSGLRPFTEMEFEKACRGTASPNSDDLASGTSTAHATVYTIVNDGSPNALVTDPGTGIANLCYSPTDPGGPMRVGIFAASAVNKTREETGGSYYGVMELSGNLYERCIGVGNPVNRAFQGGHGNGALSASGLHNVTDWPVATSTAGATAYRGGSWANSIGNCTVADRTAAEIGTSITNSRIGMRGARTAE